MDLRPRAVVITSAGNGGDGAGNVGLEHRVRHVNLRFG